LDETKVCVRCAKKWLAQQDRWRVDDFMPLWKQVPNIVNIRNIQGTFREHSRNV
jgi:hypothetical protein